MENVVNLVERRQLDAEGDWRVLFQQCKRAKVLCNLSAGLTLSAGIAMSVVRNRTWSPTLNLWPSSPVRLLLLVILGAL